ncbi:SEL1-like repeat protein [Wenzhouxiangella sp. EGI_FJ10305]|uniref:hypothetical protein n=1 Tax=Wenzhouxiangella sp. EGI_FJ10305 TaxID=3243768 RepID=UPI0035E298EC
MINIINICKCLGLFAICAMLLAGCGKSSLVKGNEAFLSGDYASAEAQWRELAGTGDADAQHNLGVFELHRGDAVAAARWWKQAVAQEFEPSMLALARLELMSGRRDAAVSHFRRAARWGNGRAVAALEKLGEPVPQADLRMAFVARVEYRQEGARRELDRSDRNESLNQMLDKYAYLVSEQSD